MALAWLTLAGFRSYPQLRWTPSGGINILVGPNGVGKTNLLEAVGILFTASSFRGAPDRVLVSLETETAVVRGETDDDAPHTVELLLHRRERRRLLLNGSRVSRVSELARVGRLLFFLPEHLDLVKGGPALRRAWLDETAALLWPVARADQLDYHKGLRQRNAFLKTGDQADRITLEVWDQRLSSSGARVMAARARAFHEVLGPLSDAVTAIAGLGESLAVDYRSGWGGELDPAVETATWEERLRGALQKARRRDFLLGATTAGPHRDEPVVTLNGRRCPPLRQSGGAEDSGACVAAGGVRSCAARGRPPGPFWSSMMSSVSSTPRGPRHWWSGYLSLRPSSQQWMRVGRRSEERCGRCRRGM